jgi:hypothetical protein
MFCHSRLNIGLKTGNQCVPNHIMSQRSRSAQDIIACVKGTYFIKFLGFRKRQGFNTYRETDVLLTSALYGGESFKAWPLYPWGKKPSHPCRNVWQLIWLQKLICCGKWRSAVRWIMSAHDGSRFLRNVGTYLRKQDVTRPKRLSPTQTGVGTSNVTILLWYNYAARTVKSAISYTVGFWWDFVNTSKEQKVGMREAVVADDISAQFCTTPDKFTRSCCRKPRQMRSADPFCIHPCTLNHVYPVDIRNYDNSWNRFLWDWQHTASPLQSPTVHLTRHWLHWGPYETH